jgi:hypothetical protein
MRLIGRQTEKALLDRCLESREPEFLAIYGRRRVGKTFLVKEHLKDRIIFSLTGMAKAGRARQLTAFDEAMEDYGHAQATSTGDWFEAFHRIKQIVRESDMVKKVIFIDELPWLATPRSDFISALEHFWNSWGSLREDLVLIVCGSATSWIIDKVINDYGGLHNRVTRQLQIEPFNLYECEEYLRSRGVALTRYQIVELCMVFGGIPYYLSMVEKGFSPAQNIDKMLFEKNAPLAREFNALYASLFKNYDKHVAIVRALARHGDGLTREEIGEAGDLPLGGRLSRTIQELEQCGFIQQDGSFKKGKKNGARYRLIDAFTLFYLEFIDGEQAIDRRFWQNRSRKGEQYTWYGQAFERLCWAHARQIKQRLGIAGVSTRIYPWRTDAAGRRRQIDLVIDRDDGIINICEMKFSVKKLTIDQAYDTWLRERAEVFREVTGTKKALHTVLVTTSGITQNSYVGEIQSQITLDDLFQPDWA